MSDWYPSQVEQQELFASLGRAITDWANLEDELFEITASILGSSRHRTAIVFYRTPTLESRTTLTSDLVESLWPSLEPGGHPAPLLKEWKTLQADIKSLLPVRNSLAHHQVAPVVSVYTSDGGKNLTFQARQASHKSNTQRLRKPDDHLGVLGIKEITAHIQAVSEMINRLRNFRDALAELPRAHFE
jgi:hypothetical protein